MAEGPPDQYDFDPAYEINTDDGWLKDGAVMGDGVKVSLDGMEGFSQNIHQIHNNFNGMSGTILGPLSDMLTGAFPTPLPWARNMSLLVSHNIEQLGKFNSNISIGVMNVASAAQVVANVFGDTDAGSAADLEQAIDFAFGNKKAAPDNVPQYILDQLQTWNEFMWPLAVLNPDNPTVQLSINNLANAHFQDYTLMFAGTSVAVLPLLIVFIMSIPVATHSVDIDLPVADPNPPPNMVDPVKNKIEVMPDNSVLWNGAPVDLVTLRQYLDITTTMTPTPARWQASTKRAKPSGSPWRAVGAYRPIGW